MRQPLRSMWVCFDRGGISARKGRWGCLVPAHTPPVVNIRTIARHSRYPTSIQARHSCGRFMGHFEHRYKQAPYYATHMFCDMNARSMRVARSKVIKLRFNVLLYLSISLYFVHTINFSKYKIQFFIFNNFLMTRENITDRATRVQIPTYRIYTKV